MSQFFSARSDFAYPENKSLYSSDYLTNKKNKLAACGLRKSIYCKKKMIQSDYLALNKVILSQSNVVTNPKNLVQNTFYLKNLYGIPVLGKIDKQTGTTIDSIMYTSPTNIVKTDVPFYYYYTIDPTGVLFGNACDAITDYQ
jgi:uncharacterized protein YcsI (UPF0317 family)